MPGETLVVGVSGGPDSVCLLHILAGLRSRLEIGLHVVHLNHMLRGVESDTDAEYVAQLAHRLEVPATIERIDVEDYRRERHLSLEEAAREVRYGLFARVAGRMGISRVAVGHTADDQLETILMHLVRGVGIDGLRGMSPLTSWKSLDGDCQLEVVRPLLEIKQDETEAYCQANRLDVREDSSNISPRYLRNRVRRELLPLLRDYNSGFDRLLLRTAHLISDDVAFLEEGVSSVWNEVVDYRGEVFVLDSARMRSLSPSLQHRIFREVLRRLLGSLKDIEGRHIDRLVSALSLLPGRTLSLPRGLTFSAGYGECLIGRDLTALCPFPPLEGEHRLRVPGETILPGWRVEAAILPQAGILGEGLEACMDLRLTGGELLVRGRRDGDKFHPLGMEQSKKLQDFMVDAKIPRAWRERIPLVCSGDHIVWVVGWRIDNRAKVTSDTTEAVHLKFEPQGKSKH